MAQNQTNFACNGRNQASGQSEQWDTATNSWGQSGSDTPLLKPETLDRNSHDLIEQLHLWSKPLRSQEHSNHLLSWASHSRTWRTASSLADSELLEVQQLHEAPEPTHSWSRTCSDHDHVLMPCCPCQDQMPPRSWLQLDGFSHNSSKSGHHLRKQVWTVQ